MGENTSQAVVARGAAIVAIGVLLLVACGSSADDQLIDELLAEDFHGLEIAGWSRGSSLALPDGELLISRGDEREVVSSEFDFIQTTRGIRITADRQTTRTGVHAIRGFWTSDEPAPGTDDYRRALLDFIAAAEADGYTVLEERCADEFYVVAARADDIGVPVIVEAQILAATGQLAISQTTRIAETRATADSNFDFSPADARCVTGGAS